MLLGIVEFFWSAFLDLVNSILNINYIFYIGVGFLLIMSLFYFIKTRKSYEYKLEKTIDRLNEWLNRNQTITEQNLVEFNNIIKEKKSPVILRKYWQQYMLYRDKAPSEYMSTYNCIDKPLKTSDITSTIKNYSMIYKFTALATFFLSLFCFFSTSSSMGTEMATASILSYLTQSMVSAIVILFLGIILTLELRAIQNNNIATLYNLFNVFSRYIDKASATIPKYVDFEILFTKKEIADGIPILGEYLEKRARQEQEELEEAQRNAVSHEEYDFSSSGIDGSLVLERAMKESETFLNIKQRLLTEIQQFESEISTLKKNYENTSKDYQRKLQVSKENLERLRQQQEESTNRIEVNYIRKQQQDEVKKQEQLEKDQEDATNKFNTEVNSLSLEIEKRRTELEAKKEAVQVAMLNEYQTFSSKIHKSISDSVEQGKNESIAQINKQKEQYAQAIHYLKNELNARDAIIESKNQIIEELKQKTGEQIEEQEIEKTSDDENAGHYDNKGYYWYNNGTYYDNSNLYHDLEGNVYDVDGNLVETGAVVEQEEAKINAIIETAQAEVNKTTENVNKEESQEEPKQTEETLTPEPEMEQTTEEQKPQEQNIEPTVQTVNEEVDLQENQQETVSVDNKEEKLVSYDDGSYYDKDNLYHSANGKLYNTEGKEIVVESEEKEITTEEEKPEEKEQPNVEEKSTEGAELKNEEKQPENREEQPKRKAGRPKKEKTEDQVEQPKRKAGRPKKEATTEKKPTQPKRKAGRPKKERPEGVQEQPKRKAGRPKKVSESSAKTNEPKRKAGRPKKQTTETESNQPKRRVGRPKKEESSNTKLLKQLGQSLINLTNQEEE